MNKHVRDVLLVFSCIVVFSVALHTSKDLIEKPLADRTVASVQASKVFSLTNSEREKESVPTLSEDVFVSRAAQLKAEDMAKNSYYAHVSPEGVTPMHWLDVVGYKYNYMGENLTVNILDSEDVVSAWMGSPAHRHNILDGGFKYMGVGVAKGTYKGQDALFVVQMFATPPAVLPPAKPKTTEPVVPIIKLVTPNVSISTPPQVLKPTPISETPVGKDIKEIVRSLTDSTATSTLATSTVTASIPFVISTTSVPIELRVATTAEILIAYHPDATQNTAGLTKPTFKKYLGTLMISFSDRISRFLRSM
ncbi:MAG: hypothetical protein JWN64_732 [Parcubacteria group bacterium]|nr:hypothetical protein [Parcubacteria group bacterium]